MAPPINYTKQFHNGGTTTPSHNLWVGNLSSDVSDSDLMDLFSKYGALDSVTTYSARNYAFVFFKLVNDAKAAKEALQGAQLRGNSIKIEFTRPAKPCKILWIGGISPSVSKEQLEGEFRKFGNIEDFRFLRDRNTASVEYVRLEDASEALRNLSGKRFGGEEIRVDFLRSQPSRREQWNNTNDPRDGAFPGRGMEPSDVHPGLNRWHSQAPGVRKEEGQPSNVLCIAYPPFVQIDEQMLHNAMILFGEIEKIKSYPSKNYAFVEFRSSDEARRAKEGLQGRLFNDPRITIMFSNSDLVSSRDYPGLYPGVNGPRPDMFFNEQSLRPPHMDMFGYGHPNPSNGFSRLLAPGTAVRPNMTSMSFGPQSGFEPGHSVPEHGDLTSWRRPSSPHILPSVQVIRPSTRPFSGLCDLYDERDPKRSRGQDGMELDDGSAHGKIHRSPVGSKVRGGDYVWRGVIAKGGTPVCQARCVPLGKGIETELPEVVNCSARTGLDMLTKHYAEAIGFDIVFFLPDSESDFASYTEFLRYLAAKDRAGVVKFDDGSTLFLVPPSNFLTKVLKVTGPERLYGVVLKLPQQNPGSGTGQQESHHTSSLSQYTDRRPVHSSRADFNHAREEKVLPMPTDYGRVLHGESNFPAKPQFPPGEFLQSQSVTHEYTPSNLNPVSQTGVKLTPELIASLASFLPGNKTSASVEGVRPPTPQMAPPNRGVPLAGWNQDRQSFEPAGGSFQQFGNQFNPQTPQPQIQHYSSVTHAPPRFGSTQFQDYAAEGTPQDAASSRTLSTFPVPHSAYMAPSQPATQLYEPEVPTNTQKANGVSHGTDSSGLYNSFYPQAHSSGSMPNQVYTGNFSQPQNILPSSAEKVVASNQAQKPQAAHPGAGQGVPEEEVDKNQRYQSTLQFAANLLLQIQQKQQQQQTNTAAGQGNGNQL